MLPLRLAVVDDHEIDVAGIIGVLGQFGDRFVLTEDISGALDVVLYGVRERETGHDDALHALLRTTSATVIAMGWSAEAPHVAEALACGAHGHLPKTTNGVDLVAGIERIHHGRAGRERVLPEDGACHPVLLDLGLTPRELEVLTLITEGLTNQQIADRAFISINSVKTYIRTAYRKIGVTRRAQAVSWGIRVGLVPERQPEPVG